MSSVDLLAKPIFRGCDNTATPTRGRSVKSRRTTSWQRQLTATYRDGPIFLHVTDRNALSGLQAGAMHQLLRGEPKVAIFSPMAASPTFLVLQELALLTIMT